MSNPGGGDAALGNSPVRIPAATIAARRVAEVRDLPRGRLELLLTGVRLGSPRSGAVGTAADPAGPRRAPGAPATALSSDLDVPG